MRFLRFRIISLLLLMAVVAGVLAWWVQPQHATAVAGFMVSNERGKLEQLLAPEVPPPTDREIEAYRATAKAILLGPKVIRTAMKDPAVQKTFLRTVENPEEWIIDHLSAEYESESEILHVRLEGPNDRALDLEIILRSICDAYLEEYVRSNRIDQVKVRDSLRASRAQYTDALRQSLEALYRLESEMDDSPGKKAELRLRRDEVETLTQTWKEMSKAIERYDLLLSPRLSGDSIQVVEAPYIESD